MVKNQIALEHYDGFLQSDYSFLDIILVDDFSMVVILERAIDNASSLDSMATELNSYMISLQRKLTIHELITDN